MATFWNISAGDSPNWPQSTVLWEAPQCAYHSHKAKATRMAIFATSSYGTVTGETMQPLCRNHHESELRDFIRWEPLRTRH